MTETAEEIKERLVEGAVNEAGRRLQAVRSDLEEGVTIFIAQANAEIEKLRGKAEEDLGASLFKTLADLAIAAIPGAEEARVAEQILAEVGKEAAKALADTFADGVQKAADETLKERYDAAQDQLRHVVTELGKTALTQSKNAYDAAEPKLAASATAVLDAHPELAHTEPGAEHFSQIADDMGFVEPGKSQVASRITEGLNREFQSEMAKVKAGLAFEDLDGQDAKAQYLVEEVDPADLESFLASVGEKLEDWKGPMTAYKAQFGTGGGSESDDG